MAHSRKVLYHYQAFFSHQDLNIDKLIEIARANQNTNVHLQLIDPTLIVSKKQIMIAIYHTLKAFENKRNTARTEATEFLLRISGKNQISSALELFGIKEESKSILLITFGGDLQENKKEVENFLNAANIPNENKFQIKFPLLSIKELSAIYNCEEDIEIIRKTVYENMAALSIL